MLLDTLTRNAKHNAFMTFVFVRLLRVKFDSMVLRFDLQKGQVDNL